MEENNNSKSINDEQNSKNSKKDDKDKNTPKEQEEKENKPSNEKEIEEDKEILQDENNPNENTAPIAPAININLKAPEKKIDKNKRKRRGKNEVSDRRYKCPECDRSYLSGPALTIHRKTKHQFTSEAEGKSRGRPKKESQQENSINTIQNKFNDFFNNETRKKNSESNDNDNNIINLDIIKNNLNQIYKQCKSDILFSKIENIEDYPLYQLLVDKWEKENPEFTPAIIKDINHYSSPILDDLFFLYLKEASQKANKDYFWFINKFIVLFREFINISKNEDENNKENKEYSQLYGAEGIPEICNDFFLDFMEPKEFFGLNNNELIQLTQHFSFWLYSNKYSHSYVTLI